MLRQRKEREKLRDKERQKRGNERNTTNDDQEDTEDGGAGRKRGSKRQTHDKHNKDSSSESHRTEEEDVVNLRMRERNTTKSGWHFGMGPAGPAENGRWGQFRHLQSISSRRRKSSANSSQPSTCRPAHRLRTFTVWEWCSTRSYSNLSPSMSAICRQQVGQQTFLDEIASRQLPQNISPVFPFYFQKFFKKFLWPPRKNRSFGRVFPISSKLPPTRRPTICNCFRSPDNIGRKMEFEI